MKRFVVCPECLETIKIPSENQFVRFQCPSCNHILYRMNGVLVTEYKKKARFYPRLSVTKFLISTRFIKPWLLSVILFISNAVTLLVMYPNFYKAKIQDNFTHEVLTHLVRGDIESLKQIDTIFYDTESRLIFKTLVLNNFFYNDTMSIKKLRGILTTIKPATFTTKEFNYIDSFGHPHFFSVEFIPNQNSSDFKIRLDVKDFTY